MDGLRDHLARFNDSFLLSDHSHLSVNDMWVSFKSEVNPAIEMFILTKMTKIKYSLPWIDSSIKRLIRNRDKHYFRGHKSSSPDIKRLYKRFRAHVQKVIRDAYLKLVSNIFSFERINSYPNCHRENEKVKLFWPFVKSLKKDAFGITTLREMEFRKLTILRRANTCNKILQLAFTRETDTEIPSEGTKGVLKLLNSMKVHKASVPDGPSARVLK